MNTIVYIVVALGAFLTGLSKGGLGGMMGALITVLLSQVMPIQQGIGLLLPILMLGDVFAVAAHWRRWDKALIWLLIPGALVGVTIGTVVITNLSSSGLRRGLGIIVLLFVAYRLFEGRILTWLQYQARRWHGAVAGAVAGFTSTLAHAGGPPITIYLLMQDLDPRVFVSTAALFFAVLNWIKVPYYFYAGLFDFDLLWRLAWLAPLVPLGVWTGRLLVERVDKRIFERILLGFLAVSAVILLAR